MTVEVKTETTHVAELVVPPQEEPLKAEKAAGKVEAEAAAEEVGDAKPKIVEKNSSFKEESNFLTDLKENEKKALNDLKSKLEKSIHGNTLFKKEEPKEKVEAKKEEETKPVGEDEKEKPESGVEEKAAECEKSKGGEEEEKKVEIDEDVSIWGIPILPSKGAEGIDMVLLKFLRAREFKVNEAFEMLKKTLQWRKELKIDSILEEDLGFDFASSAAYMSGCDREGHPICYNIFGVLDDEEMYKKTFGTEEKREQFLRWRFQLMEQGIKKLDFKSDSVNSLLQINDLKNSPGPSKKEVRVAVKQAVALLQDNYPELVARNIFINVPFWYYAFHALLSPFLTQRTKSKFVVARPTKVTETLLKYIQIEEIPIGYGGFKRDNDFEFTTEDGSASELPVKAGSTVIIEIPAPEAGTTFIWDLTVLGWEVTYKEEFVPADEGSYTIIVQNGKKMGANEGPVRNTFRTNEPGKIILTIENCSRKKKTVFYRYKIKKSCF